MPANEFSITHIGKAAQDALAHVQPASVMGKTSRGLFLQLSSGWVIFLSLEGYCGPLTLNLPGQPGTFHVLEAGSIARCSHTKIQFSEAGLSIALTGAETWQAHPIQIVSPSPDFLRAQLLSVVRLANQRQPAGGLTGLLPGILGLQVQTNLQNELYYRYLANLQAACRNRQVLAIADALGAFLGLGLGLTPSGDDLVAGFILALNRWGRQLTPTMETAVLNREVLRRARHATSALSISLLECAALGQADERLVLALDGIVSGIPDADSCVAALAGWGSSSGFDALVGMALYLMQ